MDIRTFEAFSMKDAVKSVKKALGPEAVILSTREKPAPGGKGTVYEVTASSSTMTTARSSSAGAAATASAMATSASMATALGTQMETIGVRMATLQDQSPSKRQVQALESGLQELKMLLLENLRTKDGSVIQDLPPPIVPIDRQLRVMGLDEAYVGEVIKHLRSLPTAEGNISDAASMYRDEAIRFLMKRIKIAPRWSVIPGATTVQAFVGAGGIGKTSTVAKLAAHYLGREGRGDSGKVVVVSFDNHRLAAAEQMRVFCKIIGAPFATISAASELPRVLGQHRDAELVLLDTAGTSPKNPHAVEQLEGLKADGLQIDFNLCLSITEKQSQLDQAVRAFSPLGIASLVFTKLDESWSFGEIYNLAKKWSLPLAFFSTGPEIPEGLERATRERVVERIFGL